MTTANYPTDPNAPYVILVALSTDETGEFALSEAARLTAARPNSELHVVHVVVEDGPADSAKEIVTLDQRLARAPELIESMVDRLHAVMPARVTAHIRAGQAARSILQTAVDVAADLIIVGSHQRTRLEKMIVGSVAERVLRGAHCPVLVAVPKNYEGVSRSESIQPPCPDCLAVRQQSRGATFWCERHRHSYMQPHVYVPTEQRRAVAVMPTR